MTLGEPAGDGSNLTAETMRRVGGQIRQIRRRRDLTLQQLSEQTGTSVSMLSMLERGIATPSIGTLVAVSSALGMHMSDLFEAPETSRSPLRRYTDQAVVNTTEGVVRRLVHNDVQRGVEMVVNEYAPGTSSGSEATHHAGTEFGVLLSGILTVEVDGSRYDLVPGDGISYSSSLPHRFINTGSVPASAVWVNLDA